MENLVISNLSLGVLGGGQLGKMLSLAASNWNIKTRILDLDDEMPAALVCSEFVRGDFRDEKTVLSFGRKSDVLTVEIEQVNVNALKLLKSEGKRVFPEPEILEMIQDKYFQNQWLTERRFPKPAFQAFLNPQEIRDAVKRGAVKIPFVQKTRQFGYDGKGVRAVQRAEDLHKLLEGASLIEDMVMIDKELAVMVCRNSRGQTAVYDPVEMVFNPQANLVDYLLCPAEISPEISAEACRLAQEIIQQLGMTGVLAVEMFLDKKGKIWINEMAPRPHNSGHHTIESCVTSQYEQHLRSIFNFPLGSTRIKTPSLMMNLLGEPGYSGAVHYEGLTECLRLEGVKIHIYGKKQTRPFRKMGHVTILDSNLESAKQKAAEIRKKLKVVS